MPSWVQGAAKDAGSGQQLDQRNSTSGTGLSRAVDRSVRDMTSWPLRAPGVWLHPTRNAMRIYMNTYSKIGDWVQVENIPVKKWFHTAIVLKQRNLDVFINGDMVKSYKLFGLPKQNYGDLFIHRLSGYDGFTSRLRYFNYAISYSELDKLIKQGPSPIGCSASNDLPPYLASSWWTNNYNPTDFADT